MQFNLYLSEQRKFSILCALVHVREYLEAPWAPATASAGGGNKKPKRVDNSQLLRKTSHLNQISELILKQCVANYYYADNTIAK